MVCPLPSSAVAERPAGDHRIAYDKTSLPSPESRLMNTRAGMAGTTDVARG